MEQVRQHQHGDGIIIKIYYTLVESTEELNTIISAETNGTIPATLDKVWDNMKLRLDYIKQENEEHIKNLLY